MANEKRAPKCDCAKWHGDTISEYSPTCDFPEHRKKAPKKPQQTPRIKGMESTLKKMAKAVKR